MLADVRFENREQVVVATVTGEIDASIANQLCDAIGDATANTALGVVLDLGAVDYLDSAGIHLLYRLRENLRARGQKLVVVIPTQSPVHDSLRLAGVTRHLPLASSRDEALAGFEPPTEAEPDGSDRDTPQGEPAV